MEKIRFLGDKRVKQQSVDAHLEIQHLSCVVVLFGFRDIKGDFPGLLRSVFEHLISAFLI